MDSFEAHGVAAADLALEILSGRDPATLPAVTEPPHKYQIDARQLARWQLSESNLPPQSVVQFKEPTLWERYRYLVIAVIVAFALQSAVVAFLLIQMRRRKQAEISLKESEDRLAFAAAAANIGIWRLDVATKDFWSTEHCRSILGLAEQTSLNLDTLLNAVHPEDRHSLADTLKSAADLGLPVDGEFRIAVSGQEIRWLSARGHSLFDDNGKPLGISGIFADITARKAAEAEADLQRKEVSHLMRVSVLGELSGAIAHELNQPLTAILAYAQAARKIIARKNPELGKITEVLDDIVEEDNRASEVIRRLHRLLRKGESKTEVDQPQRSGRVDAAVIAQRVDRPEDQGRCRSGPRFAADVRRSRATATSPAQSPDERHGCNERNRASAARHYRGDAIFRQGSHRSFHLRPRPGNRGRRTWPDFPAIFYDQASWPRPRSRDLFHHCEDARRQAWHQQ